jgi:ClpP class serine protease
VLDKHVAMMEMMCYGGVDLDDIDAALAYVAADANIQNVLLVFNSPGGSVIGVPETAARVAALSPHQERHTLSAIRLSAAPPFTSARRPRSFYVTPSTYSGSIGVIVRPSSISRRTCSRKDHAHDHQERQIQGHRHAAPPDHRRKSSTMLQAQSDRIMGMFTTAVKSGRPKMSADAMQGQVFFGTEAVEVGLADAVVSSLDEVLAQF